MIGALIQIYLALRSLLSTKILPVCEFEIEKSLTKRYRPIYFKFYLDEDGKRQTRGHAADNSFWLLDGVFPCRKFKVRIEKGVFITAEDRKQTLEVCGVSMRRTTHKGLYLIPLPVLHSIYGSIAKGTHCATFASGDGMSFVLSGSYTYSGFGWFLEG